MKTGLPPVHYLWLMPEVGSYRQLGNVIRERTAHAGRPSFEPHVTLLGSVSGEATALVERTRRLAQTIAPFPIAIGGLEHSEQYFRCVVLAAILDPALAAARAAAQQRLETQGTLEGFSPHLSLLYGVFSPEIRREICDSLDDAYPASFRVDRLQLVTGAPDYQDWRTIASFDLTGRAGIASGSTEVTEVTDEDTEDHRR